MAAPAPPRSFATAAASAPAEVTPAPPHPIPTGSWTLYFHEPEDKSWTPDSYKRIHTTDSWEGLGTLLREIGTHKLTNGMLFGMRGDTSPMWENRANIRGGCYCLKVSRRNAAEVYHRYLAAAALDAASANPTANPIVGVTMSPKKGFCIIKLWNANAKAFHNPAADIMLLHEEIRADEIIYRANTEQKM